MKSVNVPALCHNISSTLSQCPGILDEAVDLYNTALKDLMELHAPLNLKQRSVIDHPNHPWINEHILGKKRERRKAEKKWHREAKMIRIIITFYAIKWKDDQIAKDEVYAQKVQECEGDQKKLYKVIDCLMGREKLKTLPTASSNLLLAETFNNFFISKIRIIREQLTSLEPTVVEMSIQNLDSLLLTCSVIMDALAPVSVKEVTDIMIIKESSKATCAGSHANITHKGGSATSRILHHQDSQYGFFNWNIPV